MALLESEGMMLGSTAGDFDLNGTDGRSYSLADFSSHKVLVVMFMCNHCPYVQPLVGRMVALQEQFGERGVQLIGINPNTVNVEYEDETMEKMQEFAEAYGMNFPYLEDSDQKVAAEYGAVCTPDMFVYENENGGWYLRYHGRIDDSWKDADAATTTEMADAIEAILGGEAVSEDQKPSMGCSIKWV